MYVLDGNGNFGTAMAAVRLRVPAIVVGIGYTTEDPNEILRCRMFDITMSTSPTRKQAGGGDAFLRVIEGEVKPFVMARYRVDASKQIIYGYMGYPLD